MPIASCTAPRPHNLTSVRMSAHARPIFAQYKHTPALSRMPIASCTVPRPHNLTSVRMSAHAQAHICPVQTHTCAFKDAHCILHHTQGLTLTGLGTPALTPAPPPEPPA
eukprot:121335-Pelagomonas_calceolata.AAC.6